jgi:hypothetical protein
LVCLRSHCSAAALEAWLAESDARTLLKAG